jgi:transposase
MPTIARRPAAQPERQRLQARRLGAAELFATGVGQAEIARQLGVSRQSVHLWYQRGQSEGVNGRYSRGPTGPSPKLSDAQLAQVEQALLEGATANGFIGELWTLNRIAIVIEGAIANRFDRELVGGEKATLMWDGLPAHRSRAIRSG